MHIAAKCHQLRFNANINQMLHICFFHGGFRKLVSTRNITNFDMMIYLWYSCTSILQNSHHSYLKYACIHCSLLVPHRSSQRCILDRLCMCHNLWLPCTYRQRPYWWSRLSLHGWFYECICFSLLLLVHLVSQLMRLIFWRNRSQTIGTCCQKSLLLHIQFSLKEFME